MKPQQTIWLLYAKAIIIANIFNGVSRFLWGMIVSYYFIALSTAGVVEEAMINPPQKLMIISVLGGSLLTIISGYICERISNGAGFLVVVQYQFINTCIGFILDPPTNFSLIHVTMTGFIDLLLALLGAYLFLWKRCRVIPLSIGNDIESDKD